MELRSARRLRRSPPPPPDGATSGHLPRSSDRISALSDDMILVILSRLGSVRAAARTGLLSRRWRGLWTRLTDLVFCGDASDTIEAALAGFSASHVVSSIHIHIRFPRTHDPSSLLRTVALLSPAELMFVLKNEEQFIWPLYRSPVADVVLPSFHRVTSIELDVGLLSIGPPPAAGEFPALEKLSLAGYILDLGTLLSRCPRLRVLGVTFRDANDPLSLHAELAALETAVAVLGLTMSLLAIETRRIYVVNAAGFGPLLRAMARLSPRKVMITQKFGGHEYGRDEFRGHIEADLPCFHYATSIDMDLLSTVRFTLLPDGEFSALDTLSLPWRCSIPDLDSLVRRCPRLRVLKVALATGDVTVRSASLQDLSLYGYAKADAVAANTNPSQFQQQLRFVDALVQSLTGQLQSMYNLGARKVLFLPVGSCPSLRELSFGRDCSAEEKTMAARYNVAAEAVVSTVLNFVWKN
ncbi:uncharacterized protein [Lolium perenne]|uniref:uncharacterized protein n=1 Tax=Lolium perenne TaxID=4522 RepID=UPI0021F5128E|nr:uncharacterized protein LOC127347039 [Lolium perenne]